MGTVHIYSMGEVIASLEQATERKAAAIDAEMAKADDLNAPATTEQIAVLASETSSFAHDLAIAVMAVAFAVGEIAKSVGLPGLSDGPGIDVEVDD